MVKRPNSRRPARAKWKPRPDGVAWVVRRMIWAGLVDPNDPEDVWATTKMLEQRIGRVRQLKSNNQRDPGVLTTLIRNQTSWREDIDKIKNDNEY